MCWCFFLVNFLGHWIGGKEPIYIEREREEEWRREEESSKRVDGQKSVKKEYYVLTGVVGNREKEAAQLGGGTKTRICFSILVII